MEARLYADEHFDVQINAHLRRLGHDVLTVRQTDEDKRGDGIEDRDVLLYALENDRVVLTDNRSDFWKLHQEIHWHHGIVACPYYEDAKAKAKAIDDVLKETHRQNNGSLVGQWMTIPAEGAGAEKKRKPKRRRR